MSSKDQDPTSVERREGTRKLVCIPAYVTTIDAPERVALIRDISATGAFFLTRVPFQEGDRVEVALHFTGHPDGPSHEVTGDVVRAAALEAAQQGLWWYGIAVHFDVQLDDIQDEIERLAALLAERCPE